MYIIFSYVISGSLSNVQIQKDEKHMGSLHYKLLRTTDNADKEFRGSDGPNTEKSREEEDKGREREKEKENICALGLLDLSSGSKM